MSEDILKTIKGLLAASKGDSKRLRQIIEVVKSGEPVVMSDYRYIKNLLESPNVPENEQPQRTTIQRDTSLEVLRVRLAEGQISIEEFRVLKKALTEEE
jgi:spore germination protein GerM